MLHTSENYKSKKKHIEFATPEKTTTPPPESPLYMLHTSENYKSKQTNLNFEILQHDKQNKKNNQSPLHKQQTQRIRNAENVLVFLMFVLENKKISKNISISKSWNMTNKTKKNNQSPLHKQMKLTKVKIKTSHSWPRKKPQFHRLNHHYTCYKQKTHRTRNAKSWLFLSFFFWKIWKKSKKSFEKNWKMKEKKKGEKTQKWGGPKLSIRMRIEIKSQFNCTRNSNRNLKTTSGWIHMESH